MWFEQPTIGSAPDFFATQYRALADYLTGASQQVLATHRLVVRVEDPATPRAGGQLPWRVSADAEFVADLVARLPASYEVVVLPTAPADESWTFAPEIADQIAKRMAWVSQVNAVIPDGSPRITGFALDPDGETTGAKEALIDEMNAQRALYLPSSVELGMGFGADSLGKSLGYLAASSPHPLDEVYIEVYNLYTSTVPSQVDAAPGSTDTIYTQNRDDDAGVFAAFASLLEAEPNRWSHVVLDDATAARVKLLFSVETIESGDCIAPNASDGKCGQIDAFGTWALPAFAGFLGTFARRQGELLGAGSALVPTGNLGVFQYNFLPPP